MDFKFLSLYDGITTNIKVLNLKCEHTYETTPDVILRGFGCPVCSHKYMTDEWFKKDVFNMVGKEYTFLEPYIKSDIKIKVIHNKCKHIYYVTPDSFKCGRRCPKCFGNLLKTNEEFKQEVLDLVGNEYRVITPYEKNNIKLTFLHKDCNRTFKMTPNSFLSGERCPLCRGKRISEKIVKSDKQFKNEVFNLVGDEYLFLEEYKNATTKIKVRHNISGCQHEYYVQPNNFLTGNRCPNCSDTQNSKGVKKIKKYLNNNNIDFKTEYSFNDLKGRNNRKLRFDFAIFSSDKKLYSLIEYDGQQHFQASKNWGGLNTLKKTQERDRRKDNYCKLHNIPLLRIPYTKEKEIPEILSLYIDSLKTEVKEIG